MEIYSIDEAFLQLRDMGADLAESLGDHIADTVRKWIGIPVCVGMAPTKTLAKAANRTAKNQGCRSFKMETEGQIDDALRELSVDYVWGVSSRWKRRLNRLGVDTALDLKHISPMLIRKHFNIILERTVRELNGEPCIPLELSPPRKKQIIVSRSFGKLVTSYDDLAAATATYAARLGEKLRQQGTYANSLYVWIATNPFRSQDKQYTTGVSVPLVPATSDSTMLIAAAHAGLKAIYRKGHCFKKAGVMALDLVDARAELGQGNLFFKREERCTADELMRTIDAANRRYGAGSVFFAAQGVNQGWKMRRELMSPYYTTRESDIPLVK